MTWDTRKRRVTIKISLDELEALEDTLVCWNLCKKHKTMMVNTKTGRVLSSTEIFKMKEECKNCTKYEKQLRRKSIGIMGKLFSEFEKHHRYY